MFSYKQEGHGGPRTLTQIVSPEASLVKHRDIENIEDRRFDQLITI